VLRLGLRVEESGMILSLFGGLKKRKEDLGKGRARERIHS
jgi:hypothetical protein